MGQIDHLFITIEPQKSDYIRCLTSVTVILQHVKIATIYIEKGLVWMKICNDMPQGAYFENKCFSFNFC